MPTRAEATFTQENVTPQESWFADEYLIDFNGKRAAIRVGVKPQAAATWACRRLKNPNVRAAIEQRIAIKCRETKNLRDLIIQELVAIATSRHQHYRIDEKGRLLVEGHGLGKNASLAAIKKIEYRVRYERDPITEERLRSICTVRISLWDKNVALRTLGTHLGMFLSRTGPEPSLSPSDILEGPAVWKVGGDKIEL